MTYIMKLLNFLVVMLLLVLGWCAAKVVLNPSLPNQNIYYNVSTYENEVWLNCVLSVRNTIENSDNWKQKDRIYVNYWDSNSRTFFEDQNQVLHFNISFLRNEIIIKSSDLKKSISGIAQVWTWNYIFSIWWTWLKDGEPFIEYWNLIIWLINSIWKRPVLFTRTYLSPNELKSIQMLWFCTNKN